ncbi:MAG: hypothetical protein QXP81_09045 [Nitrososphaerota archaeon]
MPRRLMIELEGPEELLRLAALANAPYVMLDIKNSVLFLMDRSGSQVIYARLGSESPWLGARHALVSLVRGTVRPSDSPSAEPGEASVAIIRVRRIRMGGAPAGRERGAAQRQTL